MEDIVELPELNNSKLVSYAFDPESKRHVFEFAGGTLFANCLVRVIKDKKLVCTSRDHGHQYGLPAPIHFPDWISEFIKNRTIQNAVVKNKVGDLIIKLDVATKIELVNDFTGYEPWQILLKTGKEYIAAAGGEIGIFD